MKTIRSVVPAGHRFEIRANLVRQIVPTGGLVVLITEGGSRFVLLDRIAEILRQIHGCFRWDTNSQTFVRLG